MHRTAAQARNPYHDVDEALSVNVFLLPPRAAIIKAMTTGRGAVVIGDYSS
jgi:hypothetical protein